MFNRISHTREAAGVPVDVSDGKVINMRVEAWPIGASVDVVVVTFTDLVETSATASEFIVRLLYVVDAFGAVRTRVKIGVATDIGAGVLVDVVTDLKFASTTSSEELKPLFGKAFSHCAVAILDCSRALQAWIPSYHV